MNIITNQIEQNDKISITQQAQQRIAELLATSNNNDLCLRIYINQTSCSNFEYCVAFDETAEDDIVMAENNVKLIVDPISFTYLNGATLDYSEDNFIIKSFRTKSCCGCSENSCC